MTKQERIAKLQWCLTLLNELEAEGMAFPETKPQVINKIKELEG